MRLVDWTAGLLVFGLVLPAVGAIRKEGRYWVEQKEGAVPAGTSLRVASVGPVSITGDTGNDVRFKITRRVRADSQREAERWFEEVPLTALAAERNDSDFSAKPSLRALRILGFARSVSPSTHPSHDD